MSETRNYVDFEIIKENWNMYNLSDGTKLKIRDILRSAWFTKDSDGRKKYSADIYSDAIIMPDSNLQGQKNQTRWTSEQLQKNIDVENCRYDTLAYESTEYLLNGNTKILIHSNLTNIARTKLWDHNGDRIYMVDCSISVTITPPKQ